jgi:poly-gamma-glutamate synthesis protein (capsule biosynthesis protein)
VRVTLARHLAGIAGVCAGCLLAVHSLASAQASQAEAPFRGTISRIDAALAKRMTGVSWRPGCPVPLRDLRLLRLSHRRFGGGVATGRLIVHQDVARDIVTVFGRLYRAGFPIRRMWLVDAYGGSDFRSIEADNTSAFNCRFVDGTRRWSEHAYGRAIDVNPIENPYVTGGRTSHPTSARFVRRTPCRRGMACPGNLLVRAFRDVGWSWGGDWRGVKDYQHFSASGW